MRLDADAIAFFENGERIGTVPAGPLQRIYLRGQVALSSGLLGRLGQMGIGVIVLSGRRAEPSLFMPRAHNDAATRVTQVAAYLDAPAKLRIARWFVEGKIRAQAQLAEEWLDARPDARIQILAARDALRLMTGHARTKPDLNTLRGLEGAAAAHLFRAMASVLPPSIGFRGRNRRPPRDPANAVLSLGYTMLMAEAALAAHGHGFDPAIGFLHDLDFGRPSLACDLAEPLRPLVDRFTWRLFAEQTLRARDFTYEKDEACLLGKAGRERFYDEIETPLTEARQRLDRMLKALREIIASKGDDDTLLHHL